MEKYVPLIYITHVNRAESIAKLITRGAADCIEMGMLGTFPSPFAEYSVKAKYANSAIRPSKSYGIQKRVTGLWWGTPRMAGAAGTRKATLWMSIWLW